MAGFYYTTTITVLCWGNSSFRSFLTHFTCAANAYQYNGSTVK